jgi:hypothetical protein
MDLVIFWIFLVLEIRSFKSLRVAIPRAPLGTTKDLAKEKSEFMMPPSVLGKPLTTFSQSTY